MFNKVQIRGEGMEEGREGKLQSQCKVNENKKLPASFPPFPPQTYNLLLLNNYCYMYVCVYT